MACRLANSSPPQGNPILGALPSADSIQNPEADYKPDKRRRPNAGVIRRESTPVRQLWQYPPERFSDDPDQFGPEHPNSKPLVNYLDFYRTFQRDVLRHFEINLLRLHVRQAGSLASSEDLNATELRGYAVVSTGMDALARRGSENLPAAGILSCIPSPDRGPVHKATKATPGESGSGQPRSVAVEAALEYSRPAAWQRRRR